MAQVQVGNVYVHLGIVIIINLKLKGYEKINHYFINCSHVNNGM